MPELSHLDQEGCAKMVDVGDKKPQRRIARATGRIELSETASKLVTENKLKKGDVLGVAQLAGIQAAKRTPELIPLCHPLIVDRIDVQLHQEGNSVIANSQVACIGRTGVEMEALTAVSVALLTVYDMCKAVDKHMGIGDIRLLSKEKHDVEQN